MTGRGDMGRMPTASGDCEMDRVEVYLRVKPLAPNEIGIADIEDEHAIIVDPQSAAQLTGQRQLSGLKAVRCTFEHIFTPDSTQDEVFNRVARPSIEDVLSGKPALIFMYGVTGSGKTYTMSGTPTHAGILPRTLDVLFNSVPLKLKAMKYLFKPDNVNGYDVRSVADAMTERQNVMLANKGTGTQSLERTPAKKKQRNEFSAWLRREKDATRVVGDIPGFCKVAVFVQYVEIYNNSVYDLLEEEAATVQGRAKGPQSRVIREDANNHCMFVFGASEVEVENADEAMDVWMRGQRRKRVANTQMNAESSRSHSVFIIKVVQAPVDETTGEVLQKNELVIVSQLNLVDLAGCERAHRTAATGDRLKEASSINNSLMTLRQCLDALRENQQNPTANRIVPYRDSKLTQLFKCFFEGRGRIKMVVCVSPRAEDCAETLEVMRFSETAQEIEVQRVQPNRVQQYVDPSPVSSVEDLHVQWLEPVHIPACLSAHMHSEADVIAIKKLCKDGAKEIDTFKATFEERAMLLRDTVRNTAQDLQNFKVKASAREKECKQKSKALQDMVTKLNQESRDKDSLKEKFLEVEAKKESAEKRAQQLEDAYRKAKDGQVRIKKDLETKWFKERELLVSKMDRVLNEQKTEAMKKGAQIAKANLLKDIINVDEFRNLDSPSAPATTATPGTGARSRTPKKPQPLKHRTQTFHTLETHRAAAASSQKSSAGSSSEPDLSDADALRRLSQHGPCTRRRSKSNDARWLEHTDAQSAAPNDVLLQPHMAKKKSVTKLETRDLKSADNYALVTSEGHNLQVVKGDVMKSPTGGAAVVFTDVETLTRSKAGDSTGAVSKRRDDDQEGRRNVGPMDTKKRCGLAIEGHPYLRNVVRRGKDEKFV